MKKNAHHVLIIFLVSILTACASAPQLQKQASLESLSITDLHRAIDVVLQDSILSQTKTGIKIVSLKSGETLYAKDSNLLFHPASNMKLFTTSAALKYLGPDFRFKTILYADTSAVEDSTITGNLYLKGYADPIFTHDDLRRMVEQLKSQGIKRISGDIICDASYLDDLYQGSGWMWDDVSSWYWPPISSLVVDRNCVTVTVKPGKAIGDSLIYHITPESGYMKFENHGITVAPLDTLEMAKFKVQRIWKPVAKNIIVIEGGRSIDAPPRKFIIDVVDAAAYAGTLLADNLKQSEIVFQGSIQKGLVPDTSLVLVEHDSKALSEIVRETNKPSDNLYAEEILKTLGAEVSGVPGTAKKGLSVVKEMLTQIDVDTTKLQFADGSGVSRYVLVTPAQIVTLLKEMNRDFKVQAEFKTSLPIAGTDGTLEHRMQDTAAKGLLRAKTGTLNGVSALSGYTVTADGEPVAFSIIMEHFVVPTSRIRAIQDKIGTLISLYRRTNRLTQ